jgi:tetratricopeptide (TPR) repeat protein
MTQFTYILYVAHRTDQVGTGSLKVALAWRGPIGGGGERIVRSSQPRTMFNNNDISIPLASWPAGGSERLRGTFSAALIFVFLFTYTSEGMAAVPCDPPVGEAVSVQGLVEFNRAGQLTWQTMTQGEPFCAGDSIRTASRSRAAILLTNQTLIRLDEDTSVTFTEIEPAEPSWLDLLKGGIHFLSRTRRSLKVKTPFVNAAIEGTEFVVRVTPRDSGLWVYEGVVVFENAQGSLTLRSGEAAVAEAGKAPARRLVVDPLEAVQWALYYPPVIDYSATTRATGPDQPAIEAALDAYRRNDLDAALTRLDAVPVKLRSSTYYTFHAGLLLSLGRVDQAQPDIDRALALDPADGTAYALRSIIALVRNETDKALSLAGKGAKLAPKSSVPRIALSYAYQAQFDIQQARDSASQAVSISPEDALAWARLSELELSLGELDKALAAARQAASLDPDIARTQTILGFTHLTEVDIDEAKTAFQKAIALDQAAPLPRLGLGLATIRAGDLDDGVRELEIAASLDPKNSLIRSYLGKGYYDQKREKLAATEFEMAKRLDPKDPTPHFYDAILKQTTNRPVEALRDLQKSIELNNNRAVYRSRLLLDGDLAARSASLGRIYNDLGFQQLGLLEGWKSVNTDPSNYSAHRLLADNYAVLPRHEIARVSELLQSQLLQPINITPVQPQLGESHLLILEGTGPADPSFNEFNPFFVRNRLALQVSGAYGNNHTWGDELTQSGLWNKFSYSLGQFHFETDGFRKNNTIDEDLYNVFTQANISPQTSVQAEFRYSDQQFGDLPLRIVPAPDPFRKHEIKTKIFRVGGRYAFTPQSEVIGSFIYRDLDGNIGPSSLAFDFQFNIPSIEEDGYLAEAQYLFHSEKIKITSGIGHFDEDKNTITETIYPPNIDLPPIRPPPISGDKQHTNIYFYSLLNYPRSVTWTLGASADFLEDERSSVPALSSDQFNPKFGLMWKPFAKTTLRAAAFRTLNRSLVSNQTLEPTQIAGFNQFFQEFVGTDAWRYGVGLDQKFSEVLYGGVEYSERELEVVDFARTFKADWNEKLLRTYLHWVPLSWLATSAEYEYEQFKRDRDFVGTERFKNLKTHRVPLGVNFFHPSGFFAGLKTTFVYQDAKFKVNGGGDFEEDHSFWVVDASVGYRLPKRWGFVSLQALNLFDKDLDSEFQETDISYENIGEEGFALPNSRIYPQRLILARFSLSF